MKYLGLFILIMAFVYIGLTALAHDFFGSFYSKKENDYYHKSREGLLKIAIKYTKKFDLCLVATGGSFHGGIKGFVYRFESKFPQFDIEKVREQLVTIKEEMLDYINSEECYRVYLNNYPFHSDDMDISVSSKRSYNIEVYRQERERGKPRLDFVFCSKGTIFYCSYNIEQKKFEDVYVESYEEAKRLVGR